MIGALVRASDWLHRERFIPDVVIPGGHHELVAPWSTGVAQCERHGIAHTGKLARSIVIDLAVHDACLVAPNDPIPAPSPPIENRSAWPAPSPLIENRSAWPAPSPLIENRSAWLAPSLLIENRSASGERAWHRALARAEWVIGRLAPDPLHGGLVFRPGRFDARNNSTSLIDAGECVDALAELIRHPRFETVAEGLRTRVIDAVSGCASTYLSTSVATRGIVNQMLWGAMGLAHACVAVPSEPGWRDGVRDAVNRALGAQHPDGSWGYELGAGHAMHPGTSDLTVYYHGRCLAFLHHILDCLPEIDDGGRVSDALRRGTDFLAGVVASDGRKPLGIEGKRWFWSGQDEVGSHAFDIHALVRGARLIRDDGLLTVAWQSWRSLVARIDANGAVRAGGATDPIDIVCPDFHTADLAWVARVWRSLEGAGGHYPRPIAPDGNTLRSEPPDITPTARHWADAGVALVTHGPVRALVRTRKSPANTQWGGAVGGVTVVAVATGPVPWVDGPLSPGSLTVRWTGHGVRERLGEVVSGTRRFLAANRPGREGRQWAFVWRMQARSAVAHLFAGQSRGAWHIGWEMVRGVVARFGRPFFSELHDHASLHYACTADGVDLGVSDAGAWIRSSVRLARRNGSTPAWASGLVVNRQVHATVSGIAISDSVEGEVPVSCSLALHYVLPVGATDVRLRGTGAITILTKGADATRVSRGRTEDAPGPDALPIAPDCNTLRLGAGEPDPGWCVWQGNAQVRAMVRACRLRPPGSGTARWSLEVTYGRPS